jgi:phospholipid/cholesterol/gamma-HCH transport system substrate-binding protein
MKLSNEAKVGGLILLTGVLAAGFAWVIGIQNPFNTSMEYYVTYNFAGGIEVGSPVRVSGIKVGRVEKIDFFVPGTGETAGAVTPSGGGSNNTGGSAQAPGPSPSKGATIGLKEPGSASDDANAVGPDSKAIAPLRLKISVRKDAAVGVRKDSRFYINLAGIIGERYIEITPGHMKEPQLASGDLVAGIDPPRIDQLLSQSFDLAGKIADIIEENKGDITKSIELLYKLSGNLNQTLAWVDKSSIFKTDLSKLVNNLIQITTDVRVITDKTHTPEGEKTLKLLHELLFRLEPLDAKAIRTFLQKEGVKVQMF